MGKLQNNYTDFRILTLLTVLLAVVTVFSFGVGRYQIDVKDIVNYIFLNVYTDENVPILISQIRMPRIGCAILAGGGLAVSGAAYQGLFRNPLVSPDILGVSAGAGFGAAAAIVSGAGIVGVQAAAFTGGIVAVAISITLTKVMPNFDKTLVLVLAGMIVGSLFSALLALMKYVADSESKLPDITFWLMGSLSAVTVNELEFIATIVTLAIIPLLLNAWKLNVLAFGDDEAQTMGLNTVTLRILVIICASLLTASIVSVTGLIGWVGLIVPHFTRFVAGPNHKILLPASFLTGATFMLLVDDLARSVNSLEIPLGIITAIIGAPLFFVVLKVTSKKVW